MLTSLTQLHRMIRYPGHELPYPDRMTEEEEHDMSDFSHRLYNNDDVNRIIRRALKIEQSESISHRELLETARELGIDPTKIEAAINQEASTMEREAARNKYLLRKRSKFKASLWSYVIINFALFIINCMTPGQWWFQWLLVGWGIGLAMNFRKAYFPTEYQLERATRSILRQKRRRQWRDRFYSSGKVK